MQIKYGVPLVLSALHVVALGCGGDAPQRSPAQSVVKVDANPAIDVVALTQGVGQPVASAAIDGQGGDENDPMTHVNRLADATLRSGAVERLRELFERALTAYKNVRNGPKERQFLDVAVQPLAQHCVKGDFDKPTQSKVIALLSDARDVRGLPCLSKTLTEYEPDVVDNDVRVAARGVAAMKGKDAAGSLFGVFKKVRASSPKAATMYRDVNEAVVALSDPSWEEPCIGITAKPIQDKKDLNSYNDESYWQLTCAQVLGNLRSEKAIPNLIKIMLSPMKVQVQSTAINALIKIGKPAVAPTLALLEGKSGDLVEYAKSEALKAGVALDGNVSDVVRKEAAKAYFLPAAVMLGSIGRPEAVAPMIAQIGKTDEVGKVIVARELLKLPISPASMKAVRDVYEKTSLTLTIPPGMGARGALADQLGYTFDSSVVPWIVKETLQQRGADEDLEEVRGNAFVLALKLATPAQLVDLDKLGNQTASGGATIAQGYEKEVKVTKALLHHCGDDLNCYMSKLTDPTVHVGDRQFVGIKAAYMVGVLGTETTKPTLIDLIPHITGDAARFVVVQAIDHFSPKGDPAAAARLLGMLAEAEEQKNSQKVWAYSYFRQFGFRLLARQ